ncbi:hypothetical protein J6590_060773 [Homalodisca vitripennis]|nr:hypothetical protein J6590_060773 [Homalodisca vitripennis]
MLGLYHAAPRSMIILNCWLPRHHAPVLVDHVGLVSRCPAIYDSIALLVASSSRSDHVGAVSRCPAIYDSNAEMIVSSSRPGPRRSCWGCITLPR